MLLKLPSRGGNSARCDVKTFVAVIARKLSQRTEHHAAQVLDGARHTSREPFAASPSPQCIQVKKRHMYQRLARETTSRAHPWHTSCCMGIEPDKMLDFQPRPNTPFQENCNDHTDD